MWKSHKDWLGEVIGLLMEHHGLEVPEPWSPPEGYIPQPAFLREEIFSRGCRHTVLIVTGEYVEVYEYYKPLESYVRTCEQVRRRRYVRIHAYDVPRICGKYSFYGMFDTYCYFKKRLGTADALQRLTDLAKKHRCDYEFGDGKNIVKVHFHEDDIPE